MNMLGSIGSGPAMVEKPLTDISLIHRRLHNPMITGHFTKWANIVLVESVNFFALRRIAAIIPN